MRCSTVLVMCMLTTLSVHGDIASWTADSGQLPEAVLPYSLTNTASPEVPELAAGELVLSTSARSENMYYSMTGNDITPRDVTEIRFGIRLGPGSSTADSRGHAAVVFTPGTPAVGNSLHLKDGMIFLMASPMARGATATVDTTSVVHDYTVRTIGHDVGGRVEVYQDGALQLSGPLFHSASHNSSGLRIGFGEISTYTRGTSYWTYFEHNAVPQTCPSPCGDEAMLNRRPTFSWCPATGATWYNLLIMREGRLYDRQWIQGATEWQPDSDLRSGSYCWWVRPWGAVTGMGDWSTGCCFSVDACAVSSVDGLSPDGACQTGNPVTLSWDADPCATHYQVWIERGGKGWFKRWFKTGPLFGTVTQTVSDAPFGAHRWWVRGWNVDGLGAWSDAATFEVGKPVPTEPSGAVDNPVTITWDDTCSVRAEWYQIWVRRNGENYSSPWVPRDDTADCSGGARCYGPISLPHGDYSFWLRAWAPGGMSRWSDEMTFSIAGP